MKELRDIVTAYDAAVAAGKQTALATVVKVEGSSYRRPGARMLVTEDGYLMGAISGGCLEGDALRKAQLAMLQRRPLLVTYDSTDEDDLRFGVQLGCNGVVYILFEPLQAGNDNNPIDLLRKAIAQRRDSTLVTVFGKPTDATHAGTCGFVAADEAAWLYHDEVLQKEAGAARSLETVVKERADRSVLYQAITPATHLLVAGAGNDAQPLVEMASILGWDVTVVDGRPTHATKQRFPKANRLHVCKAIAVLALVATDEKTAAVLMTHNYNYDLALLEALLGTPCRYVGVLGPQRKTQRMLQELEANGVRIGEKETERVFGPVGLDIGAEGGEEIALSILSEIKAVFAARNGTFLKFRNGSIYERS